jgi:Predicted AAA-ATPase
LLADEYDAYANGYMDPHDPRSWSNTDHFNLLKSFWSNAKAGKSAYGIKKVYITGVTPLLLSDLISGANDQENISFSSEIPTICGLTQSDVLEALRIMCDNEEEVQKHFEELKRHANGYHFCDERKVDPVFNTQTALSYLQVSK